MGSSKSFLIQIDLGDTVARPLGMGDCWPALNMTVGKEPMFFFVGGIQPKTVTLDDHPRMCQACGLYQARLKRVDHYISFFFIPLFRVKKGAPFLQCQSCGGLASESGEVSDQRLRSGGRTCPSCGQSIEPGFRFCPSCGKRV